MGPSARTAYVYVDGWNFYYGINRPDLHQLGFCNFWKLGQHLLGTRATVTKVRYFSATDYHTQVAAAQQKFWLRALRSVKVGVEDLGRFQRSERKGMKRKPPMSVSPFNSTKTPERRRTNTNGFC